VGVIRRCHDLERPRILEIVNYAAEAYRDVIPTDRWQEPYMPSDELDQELSSGVRFWGYEADGSLVGVMGIQRVRDVELIRHAYVLPGSQGNGVGGALLEHLQRSVRNACWWAHGRRPSGRSVSIVVTASNWSCRSARPRC
jgi:GNAT superfamily N-acetyltransferase